MKGKKALLELEEDQLTPMTDWALALVRIGGPLGPPYLMKKYVCALFTSLTVCQAYNEPSSEYVGLN